MNRDVLLVILGMALVTFLPRAIPAAFSEKMHFSPRMEKFLQLIPYTAMTCIIVPGVFTAQTEVPWVNFVGAAAAGVLGYRKCSPMLCVLGAIAAEALCFLCIV